jgi:hypothetical protein
MRPLPKPFKKIAQTVEEQFLEENLKSEGEGWLGDIYLIRLTAEEIVNIIALGKRFGEIIATDEEVDNI